MIHLASQMIVLACFLVLPAMGQHYCWPCAAEHGVVGKDTHAATDADRCYDFYFKYLNNIVPNAHNVGKGIHQFERSFGKFNESWDAFPNVLAAEGNECGTLAGDFSNNIIGGMTAEEKRLVDQGVRLPTGDLHQCPCALEGRAHIINSSIKDDYDWRAVEDSWGRDYTERAKSDVEAMLKSSKMAFSEEELAQFSMTKIFGMHSVYCPFHASGPCKLHDVERGVASAWSNNFSSGYVPLMDNNALYWTTTIGPLLDALLRDDIDFYPMVWTAEATESTPARDIYSVLVSPCGKQLIEVAALENGERARTLFHEMSIPRATFHNWNKPEDPILQPLVPLRISRAVPSARLNAVLNFYGVGDRKDDSSALGFGQARILANVSDRTGVRAVTVMLSPLAKVHLQFWSRPEAQPEKGPAFPRAEDFEAASSSNQINGGQPVAAQAFCTEGTWSVERYTDYILAVHETVMTPVPDAKSNDLTPPVGNIMDVFLDDHISWDCTAPECDMVAGGRALYNFGSRVQWLNTHGLGGNWTPYSYDPAGYGIQLHWYYASKGFAPEGPIYPECFSAYRSNGTCAGSFSTSNHPQSLFIL